MGKIMETINTKQISNILGYNFKDENILKTAFTHSSYANMHGLDSNERLEFLGDSVLNFCTTEYLYKNFDFSEGDSSKIRAYLVSSEYVSEYIKQNNLTKFLLCHNFNPHTSQNVMGDLFEAIVGAMLLDSDLETCKKFVYKSLNYSHDLIISVHQKTRDYKTELQEFLQKDGKTPNYVLVEKTGPAHLPEFTIQVDIDGKIYGKGTAHNKKDAENIAAQLTIELLKK